MGDMYRSSIQKLNTDNYGIWSKKMEVLLIREKVWEVVSKEKPIFNNTEKDKEQAWQDKDDLARSSIGLLIEDSQFLHIQDCKTAKDYWDKLKDYHQKSTYAGIIYLYRKLFNLRLQEGDNVEDHIIQVLTLFNKLNALGEELKDKFKATLLFTSLPESYNSLITSLGDQKNENFTLDAVKSRVIDEYSRRKENTSGNSEAVLKTVQSKEKNYHKTKDITCFFCKKPGHQKKECFGYKKWKNNQKNKENKEKEQASIATEELLLSKYCEDSVKSTNGWYVDSGATSHMTGSKELFHYLDETQKGCMQLAKEDKICKMEGKGSILIKCCVDDQVSEIFLEDVLYAPSLKSSLLSVKKLAINGYEVDFKENVCNIMKDERILAKAYTGNRQEDLYRVNTITERAKAAMDSEKHGENCYHIWHRRFGHRDTKAIKDLVKKDLVSGLKIRDCGLESICGHCLEGKMARKPFPKESEKKTRAILDLIHTDVCGPMQTESPAGKRYVMTIIDDYSRFAFVYFLKQKSEAGKYIKDFIKEMKTQHKKVPKCIRSDRGREYVNSDLINYLKSQGTKIQYTAPYSPQQNGVAERKNRYLIEMARIML